MDAEKATVVIAAASHLATASLVMLVTALSAHAANAPSGIGRTVVIGPPAHPLVIARPVAASAVTAPMATASLVMLATVLSAHAANGPSEIVQTVVTGLPAHHLEIARPAAASAANDPLATASLVKVQTAHTASVHSVTNLVVQSPLATSLAKADLLAASRAALLASPHSANRAASVPRVAIRARVPVAKAQIVGAQTTRVRVMVPVAAAPVENLLVAGE